MRSIHIVRTPLLTLGVFLALLAGCATSPSPKFYQLNSLQTKDSITPVASFQKKLVITVGPIRIPDYLDRPQIVIRAGKNELRLSEFNRWAGSLESDIGRVLAEDISSLLPSDHFSVVRWTPYLESPVPASCRVEVLVDRFEGILGDSVLLKAQWAVLAQDRKLLLNRESLIREQINTGSYDALVAAMSKALEKLSKEIAVEVRSVSHEDQPGGP